MGKTTPSMKQRIADDMKSAMRDKEAVRLETVRMLRAAIQRKELDDQTEIGDEGVLAIIQKMVKQSNESIKQFTAGNREDLVEKETAGMQVLESYLPAQLSEKEITGWVDQAFADTGATKMSDMGKVMGWLKPKIQGQADMGKVSALVKSKLGQN